MRTLAVIGAGAKGIAIAAKARALATAGLDPPRVVLVERSAPAADWTGRQGYTDGSLPLGAADLIEFSSRVVTLQPGDRLTFLTDGVVEAMNPANELFGFDRARAISSQPAAAIVQQAQAFGQNDDITVLSIEFIGATHEAPDAVFAAV